jgi:hypothetical protein
MTTSDECPLDLSGWEPDDIIRRWREAFNWANGRDPDQTMSYERGWFCFDNGSFVTRRDRRKTVAEMIWRLENRPNAARVLPDRRNGK